MLDAPPAIENQKSKIENPPTIRVLPPDVIACIAAGEVVERPASIVKELAENALDAGARAIHVEIAAGGRELVRVSDDGRGMSRSDLELCLLPHATSKLSSADDLLSLATLGFRGEALPSIAAVSRFSLTTRSREPDSETFFTTKDTKNTKNAEPGQPSALRALRALRGSQDSSGAWRIECAGGQPQRPEPCPAAAPFGTTAEARELFFNLPARKKFLKGHAAEASACADALLRLALTRPDAAFNLSQGRHEIFSLPACAAPSGRPIPLSAFLARARGVLGKANSSGLLELDFRLPDSRLPDSQTPDSQTPDTQTPDSKTPDSPIPDSKTPRLFGLLSPPSKTAPNRSSIYLSVNGRAVKDRTLTSALLESCRHLLPPRRFPFAVLFLELPPGEVDINVHPAKTEVRFRSPGLVYALFHHAVREAFGATQSSEFKVQSSELTAPAAPRPPLGAPRAEPGQNRFDLWPRTSQIPNPQTPIRNPQSAIHNPQFPDRAAEAAAPYAPPLNPKSKIENPKSVFRVLGQAGGSYIVAEDDAGVKLIDQHALHERILFEELLARAERRSRGDSQGLLIPETLELSPLQAAAFSADSTSAAELLADLGFAVEAFGPRALAVRAVPAVLKSAGAAALVRDLLEALGGCGEDGPARNLSRAALREKAVYTLSCKGAIKAGERLTVEQMTALLAQYLALPGGSSYTCPHGRPLAVELSWEDLEHGVGRR